MKFWLLVLCLFTSVAQALQVTGNRGLTITLPQSPQRIVSLLPSLTEMVCELGRCDRLVGVDRYSNFPAGYCTMGRRPMPTLSTG